MWYSCTTLAVELKIEVLYKRDDGVWNMFGSGVGDMNKIMLHVYKINTKNRLTRYFLWCIIISMIGATGHLRSNYKAITKQLQNKLKQIKTN